MITGFNTDVEYDGVTYHVQTEDKGLESPLILSLVYSGGAILASKRSPYDDLIAAGFDEQTLTERLQRQHKLICAAINAGRLDDLKKMGGGRAPSHIAQSARTTPEPIAQTPVQSQASDRPPSQESIVVPPPESVTTPAVISMTSETQADVSVKAVEAQADTLRRALHLGLLEERELRSGEFVTLRVRLSRGTEESRDAVSDATITLKILGTTFRPVISSARTDQDGIAIVFAALPRFTTGRAAILIRAIADGEEVEMRRIVHPS